MSIEIIKSTASLGAEVRGVDIAAGISDEDVTAIRDALHENSVVVVRNQRLTPDQQIEFCGRFGRLEPHTHPRWLVKGYDALLCIANVLGEDGQPLGLADAGHTWHTDGHFDERPNRYSMLYAIEVPHRDDGTPLGDTLFASTRHAYDQLSQHDKDWLQTLRARNSLAAINADLMRRNPNLKRPSLSKEQDKIVTHPVIRTHPVTGTKAIYVTRAATLDIIGLSESESRATIDRLADLCLHEENIYRHRWQVGDLLMWDNCSSLHCATGDYALPQRRLMHRTTLNREETF